MTKGILAVYFLGYFFVIKNLKRTRLYFSERNGFVPGKKIGPFYFALRKVKQL